MAEPSELKVITKAKDLCSYITTITHKSPKFFRFTYVTRLTNYALDILEDLYKANEIFVTQNSALSASQRAEYQRDAMTKLKMLAYFSQLAMEQGCILGKQFEQISIMTADCQKMLGAWMASDRRRYGNRQ